MGGSANQNQISRSPRFGWPGLQVFNFPDLLFSLFVRVLLVLKHQATRLHSHQAVTVLHFHLFS